MGDGGNEIVFHPFALGELLRHVVDRVAEFADLVVVALGEPRVEIAVSDLARGDAHLSHRVDDRIDEVGAGEDDEEDDCHANEGED